MIPVSNSQARPQWRIRQTLSWLQPQTCKCRRNQLSSHLRVFRLQQKAKYLRLVAIPIILWKSSWVILRTKTIMHRFLLQQLMAKIVTTLLHSQRGSLSIAIQIGKASADKRIGNRLTKCNLVLPSLGNNKVLQD
jgi:hypothetical protein